ncbi:MAG TPA: hypothetical protein DHN29_22755 [Cytophagales bacterium]|nr:hypothetical protein [Cytophagales bacterium]
MPAIQGRTRKQLRQSIGYNLGALHTGTTYDAGSTTTLISLTFIGGDDYHNGKWIVVFDTSNSDNAETRLVTDYTASAYRLTLGEALSFSTVAGDTYELWDTPYRPDIIDEFINQSIMAATGWVYDPIENITLHGDGHQTRFDIPSNISMISKIEYRHKVSSTRIHACNATFDEATDSDFTQSVDTKDKKQGSQSLKMVIAAGASAGDFVTDSITSKNLSGYDTIEMWVKSTVATSAGNLKLLLDDTASCASPLETLEIPALTADTWTFVRMSLANPETDTAIISVGLEYDSDLGACTVWIDDIVAVANDTAEWATLDRRNWKIDKESRDLVLVREGHKAVGYSLIKITGGDKPALMTADTDTCEIDENYIIAQATSLAFLSKSGGPATDPDAKRQISAFWTDQAQRARRAFPMLANVRTVD